MAFLIRRSSSLRKKASSTPPSGETSPRPLSEAPLSRSESSPKSLHEASPRPPYISPTIAHLMAAGSLHSGQRSTSSSKSSSPALSRRFGGGQPKSNREFVKVVLRDFPSWPHDQLVSLRGVPQGARCSSCACVAGTLLRAPCTCAFCSACLRNISMDSLVRCRTHDARAPRSEFVEDPYVYSLCMDLNALCIWNSDGCNFEGPLATVQEHSGSCLFREETCPDCEKRVSFRAMASHRSATCTQRKIACQLCGQLLLASTLERHISVCPDVEVLCQLCGRRDIKRGQSEAHRVECISLERPCRLQVFGCAHKATSKELRDHESTDMHLDLIVAHTARTDQRLRKLEEYQGGRRSSQPNTESFDSGSISTIDLAKNVEVLRTQILQLSNRLKMISDALLEDPFYWNLCPYKAILESATDGAQVLYSDTFYTPNIPGYKMRLRLLVDHRARLLHLTPQLLPGAFNNIMPWPFPAQYLLRLVDQSGQGLHKDLPVMTGTAANVEKPSECGRVLRSPNLKVTFEELDCEHSVVAGSPAGNLTGAMFSKNDCIIFMFKMNASSEFMERI